MIGGREVRAEQIVGSLNQGNLTAGGNIAITTVLHAEPKDPPPPESWYRTRAPGAHDVFSQLRWRARLTALVGRDPVMADLTRWATSGARVRARLLHGAGGAGKTRLAADLAEALAAEGWRAHQLHQDRPAEIPISAAGLLLVVDYPEEQPRAVEALLTELDRLGPDGPGRLRLLLVSRRGPEVWDPVLNRTRASGLFDALPLELPALTVDQAWEVFTSALAPMAALHGAAAPTVARADFDGWVAREKPHNLPLFIAALALHTVLEPAAALSLTGAGIMQALAGRERARAEKESVACGLALEVLPRLLALACIADGLDGDALGRLAALDLGLPASPAPLDRLAPSGRIVTDAKATSRLLPRLEPDLPAATFATQVLSETPERVPDWMWAAMEADPETAMGRLDRLCFDADVTLGLLDDRQNLRLSRRTLAMVAGQPQRCRRLLRFNERDDLGHSLAACRAAVGEGLLADPTLAPEERAQLHLNRSVDLAQSGDRTGALAAIGKAVDLRRALARDNPARFTPDLAASLNNLSNGLSDTGDPNGALAAIQEAVDLRRVLARDNPARFNPDLAASLNNLSSCLSDTGDRTGALAAIREAVDLRRTLARDNPVRFNPDLALSLNNLSSCLSDTGDRTGALAAIREAVDLRRTLARDNPARFTPDLAASLNNLSNGQSDTGDPNGALAAIQEAVNLRRFLARDNPARFNPDLALSLNNLSSCLSDTGDRTGALAAIREAVDLRRALARDNPARFTPDLAASLNNLSNRLSDTGDRTGALAAIGEAVDLYRALARDNPARFTPDLATSLNNLSNGLSDTGDPNGALAAIQEAVDLRRALSRDHPARFNPNLALSLNNLSSCLSDTGDRTGALAAIREAVDLRRALARDNPARFTPDLALSLNNLSSCLSDTGDRTGALAAIWEAVDLRRALARDHPARFTPDLAASLNNLSNRLSDTGDRTGALAAIREAVDLHRALARDNPARFTSDLAGSLAAQSRQVFVVGDRTQALTLIEEAIGLIQPFAERYPGSQADRRHRMMLEDLDRYRGRE